MNPKPDMPDDLEVALLGFVRESLLETGETMDADTDLFAAGLDSMGIMQLMVFAEDRLGIRIAAEDVTREHFGTVRGLGALIRRGPAD